MRKDDFTKTNSKVQQIPNFKSLDGRANSQVGAHRASPGQFPGVVGGWLFCLALQNFQAATVVQISHSGGLVHLFWHPRRKLWHWGGSDVWLVKSRALFKHVWAAFWHLREDLGAPEEQPRNPMGGRKQISG